MPTKEEIHAQLVEQMRNMDEKEIKNIADIIVERTFQIRDLKSSH